jgi:glycylpeptide N-tetradecanoyltransferase
MSELLSEKLEELSVEEVSKIDQSEDEVVAAADAMSNVPGEGEKKKRRKKKPKKKKRKEGADNQELSDSDNCEESEDELMDDGNTKSSNQKALEKLMHEKTLVEYLDVEGKSKKEHKFWDTQPVPSVYEMFQGRASDSGPIDSPKKVADVQQTPLNLPSGFEWCCVDVQNESQRDELYTLLNENYVEDDDNMFRFDYSAAFLLWALCVPGYFKDWHAGIRNSKTGALYGFISAIPATVRVHKSPIKLAEINFLCVHKKLRAKRMAPVLIKEITRRVNMRDIWQAVYTAGVVLPKPVARCRYWHRSLNPKKLIEVRFSRLQPRMTMARTIKLYQVCFVMVSVPRLCCSLSPFIDFVQIFLLPQKDLFRHSF